MAKKFFYNRVYNTKRTIINLVIIGVCIIGVIICFIITSNFQGENHNTPEGALSIKQETTIEVNEKYTNEIFFSKIENVDVNDINISYPDNFNVSKPGEYQIKITINEKDYDSKLVVVDTTKPTLTVKEVTIEQNKSYSATDFVNKCEDNSKSDCKIEFYKGVDEEGEKVDYSSFTKEGTYTIKIAASDESGNQVVEETKLTIGKKKPVEEKPIINCKYGNNKYDTDNYLVAIDVTSNGCAVSLDLYKDESMTAEINKLMNSETTKIKKDVEALKLDGTLALNRKVTAVVNTTGDGIVGYELRMTVKITKNGNSETVADYRINSKGKRSFIANPYKLAS